MTVGIAAALAAIVIETTKGRVMAETPLPSRTREKRWVCKDWYFDIEQSHVRAYANEPKEGCYFKRRFPEGEREHTERCGWYLVGMERITDE